MKRISVIIPVLDEERRIGLLLEELGRTPGVATGPTSACDEAFRALPGYRERPACGEVAEVLVVDGGSTDRTREMAASTPGTRVLVAPRGRSSQMNAGAREATGEVLLFLHADVSLPREATLWIERALRKPRVVAGAFRTWTVCDREVSSLLVPLLHLADLRSRYNRLPYGDQAIFVRRDAFFRAGGFPEQPLLEDIELGRRLRRIGRTVIVPASVRVSGRRFIARPILATAAVNLFPVLYRLGVSPHWLARLYGNPR